MWLVYMFCLSLLCLLIAGGRTHTESMSNSGRVRVSSGNHFISGRYPFGVHVRSRRGTSGSKLTYDERIEFLKIHNSFRRQVINATDMRFMVWHEALAEMAQGWCEGCLFEHGQVERPVPLPWAYIGQNLFFTTVGQLTPTEATTEWHNEKNFYNYDTNACAPNEMCGHYTQIVWAKSFYLGCGVCKCDPLISSPDNYTGATYVVCNYGPPGNEWGARPYASGTTCSECPAGTVCEPPTMSALCVTTPRCSKTCENGGTLDEVSCECRCPPRFDGDTCDIEACDVCGSIHPSNERTDCGWPKITRAECETKGCCWNTKTKRKPWCFNKDQTKLKPKPTVAACSVNSEDEGNRTDCAWKGVTELQCGCRGCCWDDGTRNTIWCYHPSQ